MCSVSSLAWFMSNQETSFVTIGQRVLANPLRSILCFFIVVSSILIHFSFLTFNNTWDCKPKQMLIVQLNFFHMYGFLLNIFVLIHRVRFHYGHPDVFDRRFHLTRGGISKASKIINLSEDILAGML